MKKLQSSFINMVLSLTGFTLLAGALLGGVYSITRGPIEQAHQKAINEAIAEVTPPFTNDPSSQAVVIDRPDGHVITIYPAFDGKTLVGAAVESYSMSGFSGEITVMYGFDANGVVTGYRVLTHAETPGLGAKMDQWFRSSLGRRSVIGLDPTVKRMYVSKDGGDIDGITAATISSRAFLGALRLAHEEFMDYRKSISQ